MYKPQLFFNGLRRYIDRFYIASDRRNPTRKKVVGSLERLLNYNSLFWARNFLATSLGTERSLDDVLLAALPEAFTAPVSNAENSARSEGVS